MNKHLCNVFENNLSDMERIRSFRHDLLNHISIVKMYLEMGYTEKGLHYINRLVSETETNKYYNITGNVDFDIIVSSKISKIKNLGAKVEIISNLPKYLNIETYDMMTILGNLLDNAYEAFEKSEEKRLLLTINVISNNLYIFVSNTYNNEILSVNNKIQTSKLDKANHGIGLNNVKKCVETNEGTFKVTYDSNEFFVEINLPILKNTKNYYCN